MKYFFIVFLLLFTINARPQETKKLMTLDEAISVASQQSLDAFRNQNMFLASYWEFRYFKADKLPSLTLQSTPFDYNRSMQKVYNYDLNRDEYKPRQYLNSDISMLLNQNIALTGGSIFARSELGMTENLSGDKLKSYTSTPFSIGYSQALNGYNQLRWTSKIEPVKYEKAKKTFIQSKEALAIKTTRRFFDLVDAQIEVKITQTNLDNADTLYRIGQGRFKVGTVTQDELLNLELGLMNARLALNRANLELERSRADLNSLLGYEKTVKVECIIPEKLPDLIVNVPDAIQKAFENNPTILDQQQRLLEQDRRVRQARSETGLVGDLYALYGLNQNAEKLDEVYADPLERQRLRIGLNIPILDWGRRKGQLAMAESNREVARIGINQEKIDFEQNVLMNTMEFNLQGVQTKNSAKADTIARMAFDVTMQRFLIGKLDVTKLNIARNDQDQARRAYIRSLRDFWTYFYTIRQLTLFDFEKKITLSEDFDRIINQ